MKKFICKMCGKEFETTANHADYCLECRYERQKQRSRAYTAKKKSQSTFRSVGDTDICPQCGKAFIINSPSQKVCADCRKAYNNQRNRNSNNAYTERNYDKLSAFVKKGERDKLKAICQQHNISLNELINRGIALALAELQKDKDSD